MSVSITIAALISTSTVIAAPQVAFQSAVSVSDVVSQEESQQNPAEPPANPPAQPDETSTAPQEPAEEPLPPPDGAIVVTGEGIDRGKDPLVELNETTFEISQEVDAAIVEPVAEVYEDGLPKPIRSGLRNFFRNLLEPVNALNFLLQLKPGKALETLGRFTINSTVGLGGLIDIAKREPFNLPRRRNGFANTLGYYGVGPGPFLVLPLVGPTTLRDALGGGLDQLILPTAIGGPFRSPILGVTAYSITSLEDRIEFDERIERINASDDPYYAVRETYLCQREADIAALKNQPAPRDCSLEAILDESPFNEAPSAEASPDVAPQENEAPAPNSVVEASPEPPAIIYVRKEMVQPLPPTPER